MIVWQFPKKIRIELEESGWWVYIKNDSFRFNTLAECLCYLTGRGVMKYDVSHCPLTTYSVCAVSIMQKYTDIIRGDTLLMIMVMLLLRRPPLC